MERFAGFVLFASLLAPAYAQVTVTDAWVRATVAQQKVTGAFMQLTAGRDLRLIEVRSPVAGVVELHESSMTNHVMKMRPVTNLELPANKTVELRPGGHHIMLTDLKGPIKEGESVPLTLVVEGKDGRRENIEVKAVVRPLTAHGHAH